MIFRPEPREMVRPRDVAIRAWVITIFALYVFDRIYTMAPTNVGKFAAIIAALCLASGLHYIGARNAIRKHEVRKTNCHPAHDPAA